MRVLFFILISVVLLFGQDRENYNIQGADPINWGEKIRLGSTFSTTDSTRLFKFNVDDSLYTTGADTLYSDALPISGDFTEGLWNVVAYAEAIGDATTLLDSIRIDVRFGEDFIWSDENSGIQHKIVWDNNASGATVWQDIMVIATNVKEELSISQSDSSWHRPAYMRQYRVITTDADVDTVRLWLTDYLR